MVAALILLILLTKAQKNFYDATSTDNIEKWEIIDFELLKDFRPSARRVDKWRKRWRNWDMKEKQKVEEDD